MPPITIPVTTKHFLFIIRIIAIAVTLLPAFSYGAQDQCRLFSDGIQETGRASLRIEKLKSVLQVCRKSPESPEKIATRTFKSNGESFLLLVDPLSLATRLERESCWICNPTSFESLQATRFGHHLSRVNGDYQSSKKTHVLTNAGLKHGDALTPGSFFTADLCPTTKGMDRELIQDAVQVSHQLPTPLALAVSGAWLRNHQDDFHWLKTLVNDGKAEITWVNHSNKHPFKPGLRNEENFLLSHGVDLEQEILETERTMIANGVTPSVFFRFPGLISDQPQMEILKKHALLPLGSNAWLAAGQKAEASSIILVHANGNEPLGKKKFQKLIKDQLLPLPFHALPEALTTSP